jgi:Bacterial regulatory proteins, tetR family
VSPHEAAKQLFLSGGYAGTTIVAIAEAADVSTWTSRSAEGLRKSIAHLKGRVRPVAIPFRRPAALPVASPAAVTPDTRLACRVCAVRGPTQDDVVVRHSRRERRQRHTLRKTASTTSTGPSSSPMVSIART